jgi:hypothetical protein
LKRLSGYVVVSVVLERYIMKRRVLLFCSSLLLLFVASIGLDRLTGLLVSSHEQGLIFQRKITCHFQTPKFAFTFD